MTSGSLGPIEAKMCRLVSKVGILTWGGWQYIGTSGGVILLKENCPARKKMVRYAMLSAWGAAKVEEGSSVLSSAAVAAATDTSVKNAEATTRVAQAIRRT
jgi:hypothetical protein